MLKFNGFTIDLIFRAKAVKVFLKLLLEERFLISQDSKYCSFRAGILNLFCFVYPLPKEKSIIYPRCTTTAFSLLKIKAFFSL